MVRTIGSWHHVIHQSNHFCLESSFICQVKSEDVTSSFIAWKNSSLSSCLCDSDVGDREFQLPRKSKKLLRHSAESFLANSVVGQTATGGDGRTQDPEGQQTATGGDGRTQDSVEQQTATDGNGRTQDPQRLKRLERPKEIEWLCSALYNSDSLGSSDSVRAVASQPMASSNGSGTFRICELFSSPRLTGVVCGNDNIKFTEPSSFDLSSGWDFFDAHDRAFFWKTVEEQQPDLIAMSPECRAFSQLMNVNWDRMNEEEKRQIQAKGLAMLGFCVQVAQYQLQRGKFFLLEQPSGASSWQTHSLRWLLDHEEVFYFWFDQCMTGLSVVEGTLSRKSTGIATNHTGIALKLSAKQCDGSHEHLRLENGLPHKAQIYPKKLLLAIISGIRWTMRRSIAGNFVVAGSEEDGSFQGAVDSPDAEQDEDDAFDFEDAWDRSLEESGAPLRSGNSDELPSLTEDQKKKINAVHVNMGHIAVPQMLSLFKAAGAKPEVLKFIKHRFNCEQCRKQHGAIDRKKATLPRTFAFNRILGLDYFFIPFQGKTLAFLNVICHGTNLQQVARLVDYSGGSPSSEATWKLFSRMWLAPYGIPEVVVSDGGSEFKAFFERSMEQAGVLQITSDASSPWQNAKVERHGGWVKSRAEAEIDAGQSILASVEDLDDLVLNIVIHKNRWFSRGGFSPAQLAFGANPRIPADLLSEDPLQGPGWDDIHLDPYDQDTPAAEFSRAHLIRRRAGELCIAQNSKDKIRLSGKGKRHPQRTWSKGQWVFVWRRTPGIPSGHITRSRWTGPGLVVLQQGHTVWVHEVSTSEVQLRSAQTGYSL